MAMRRGSKGISRHVPLLPGATDVKSTVWGTLSAGRMTCLRFQLVRKGFYLRVVRGIVGSEDWCFTMPSVNAKDWTPVGLGTAGLHMSMISAEAMYGERRTQEDDRPETAIVLKCIEQFKRTKTASHSDASGELVMALSRGSRKA
jgi:hypothetical protein